MTKKVTIEKKGDSPIEYCDEIENGNILFFPKIPFPFPEEDIAFLLEQKQTGSKNRKNIAYKPDKERITNHEALGKSDREKMQRILKNYSDNVSSFLEGILPPYAQGWKKDYASFRPFQEKGRNLRTRARNDLLHVDAFPTRPLHGARILRFFTNINPKENRHWVTSDSFAGLLESFLGKIEVPKSVSYSNWGRLCRWGKRSLGKLGVASFLRSPYDVFMLKLHHAMKEDGGFQENCPKDHWDFPPGSCWAVFTDQLSHAALQGQYALEQTFLIPQTSLVCPEKSPLCVLERASCENLVDLELLEQSSQK